MERSGAILKEVGTTNKTKISDYRDALNEKTALILRVHPSNYKIVGFTHRPQIRELVELSRERNIPLAEDAGSGLLFSSTTSGLEEEPSVESVLSEGVDLICFSGDKLLGGPQAGIILGKKARVDAIRQNPLMRACRVDKMTYAALEWTLEALYSRRQSTTTGDGLASSLDRLAMDIEYAPSQQRWSAFVAGSYDRRETLTEATVVDFRVVSGPDGAARRDEAFTYIQNRGSQRDGFTAVAGYRRGFTQSQSWTLEFRYRHSQRSQLGVTRPATDTFFVLLSLGYLHDLIRF